MKMVELRAVSKDFGATRVVKELDLEIRAGEFLTLLGPSGCGKTTVLRMISGFEEPSGGELFLAGENMSGIPAYRRDVNQVFQSYALFPHLSVGENVEFGLKMKKVAKAERKRRVGEALALIGLEGMEGRRPAELSGGQQQRVALARAVVCRPKVLLLDEPLSALDARLRQEMRMELKRLQKKLGMTFVLVTHDQEEALTLSDRIAVLREGRMEQLGSPAEIYHTPRTAFVAGFVGEANLIRARVLRREALVGRVLLEGGLELVVPAEGLSGAGTEVVLAVRPEKIFLHVPLREDGNSFPARVVEVIFKGATALLHLRTDSGWELTVLVTHESAARGMVRQGDRVVCGIDPADI